MITSLTNTYRNDSKKPIRVEWAFANIARPQVEAFAHVSRRLALPIIGFALQMSNTKAILSAIKDGLYPARIGTYEAQVHIKGNGDPRAVALYTWNAQVSAALFIPLHFCEVVVRNAAADALEAVYGVRWPWNPVFILSLPNPSYPNIYNPRANLNKVASQQPSTGKVIPELNFVFWQQLFTNRHDVRLWNSHLKRVLPEHDSKKAIAAIRKSIYADLEVIRRLRNRIAHHEPIFTRNLKQDLERMHRLVRLRSNLVASWMMASQIGDIVISQLPLFRGGKLWNPSHEEIAEVAYRLWVEKGSKDGDADKDWFEAKKLLGLSN